MVQHGHNGILYVVVFSCAQDDGGIGRIDCIGFIPALLIDFHQIGIAAMAEFGILQNFLRRLVADLRIRKRLRFGGSVIGGGCCGSGGCRLLLRLGSGRRLGGLLLVAGGQQEKDGEKAEVHARSFQTGDGWSVKFIPCLQTGACGISVKHY